MEQYLKTADNIKVAINHFKGKNKNEVIVIAPGWLMTKDSNAFYNMSLAFHEKYDVIAMDFRGHGRSKGFFTFTAKETFDIKSVVNYARQYYEKVYLLGFSLGGAMVLLQGALEQNVDKIISVSAPTEFMKIENHFWNPRAFIPTFKKFELNRLISLRQSIIPYKKLKPIDYVQKIDVPTLFIAGEKDPTVFEWHTRKLHDKAKCKKKYVVFDNANHAEDLFLDYNNKFMNVCFDWLKLG